MLVTLSEASGLTGLSVIKLKRLMKTGRLPFKLNEGVYYLNEYSLLHFLPNETAPAYRHTSELILDNILLDLDRVERE